MLEIYNKGRERDENKKPLSYDYRRIDGHFAVVYQVYLFRKGDVE